jgi:class 3 adenylate cyclase/tetratricopeptide (TPR) repeat protein
MMSASSEPSADGRQQATVVYADISGFTALSEKLDPEDVTAVMNAVFERLEAVVVARGGVVNKYIGDCVMAVFGLAPGSASPSRQAVAAAIEMRSTIRQYNDEAGHPAKLDIHIGVNTGPVVAGEIGGAVRREFTVMGDTVSLAGRLEDVSERGQILVGPRTHEETSEHFEYRTLPPLASRNGNEPVAIYELVAAKLERRRAKRPSERRQATVVFADITGFEALAERFDPDALTRLLNRCFGELEAIVRNHGGGVDKYIGGCLMALFGVPNAIEDAPRQAINAAIEMRNRLEELKREGMLPDELAVRMGVNTGLVVAGEIGGRVKREFTVMGDAVNVASRLEDAAGHGAIYVAPETHRYTKDAFEYRPMKALTLAGKEQPVPAYELASVKRRVHRDRVTSSDRALSSALVGRDRELHSLHGFFARVIAGEGGVVSVVGEAGLGKSRLIAEALRFAPLRQATVLEGRSTAIGRTLSFHTFIDLLRHWAAIGDGDAESDAFAKLDDAITGVMSDEADEVLPFVATLLGMRLRGPYAERLEGLAGEALESLITKNARLLFQRMAEVRPLVLVFEDLHWADASSLKLLEVLVRLAAERPVLFVCVFRPDYDDGAHRSIERALATAPSLHTEIRIAPLDAEESGTLVENLLRTDDLPAATRDLIARTSDGNPFYIEEVLRSLIDEGAIEYVDGRFRATAKIESVVVPGTIQEVVMARVDRLDEPSRNLLRIASVIGRSFYHRIIAEIARRQGETDEELHGGLARLQQKQLLLRRSDRFDVAVGGRTVAQELEYLFTHALAQETVYNSILKETRKEFHHLVAESIESLFGERLSEFHGMLGHHYGRADDLPKAEEHLFKAGEEAARAAASSEALAHFRAAADIYARLNPDGGDPRRRALLEKNIGYALLNVGRLTESIDYFDRALEHNGYRIAKSALATNLRFVLDLPAVLFRLVIRPHATAPVSDQEREAFEIMFKRFRAMTTSDPKRMFFDNLGAIRRMNRRDPATIGTACLTYVMGGAAFAYSGTSFALSRLFLRRTQELLRPGEVGDELGCGFFRFVINFLEGRWREEQGLASELLERGLKSGIVWEVDSYLGLECDRRIRQGRFADARERLRGLTELSDGYGYEFARANFDVMQAILLIETRELETGLAAAERYYVARDTDTLRVLALGTKAKALSLLDRPTEAQDTLSHAARILAQPGILIPPWHLSAYTVARLRHATTMLERAPLTGSLRAEARRSAREALRVAKVVAGARTETWRLVGRLHWCLGRPKAAFAWWTKAQREAERLDSASELARISAEIAVRAQARHLRNVDVPALVEHARAIFGETGLDGDLMYLDAGLRPGGESAARYF